MFLLCSMRAMPELLPDSIATRILKAPAWARVGITVRDERLRQRAADEVANWIVEGGNAREIDDRQLVLPIA